ncbi:MAG: hypothetical protein IPO09_05035 [Anaeromyxobacter sp.]|nr:hypothetical protein [Anaeromyxobacter sp.]MBL0277486.1 hypothetical protein [Anaeromyxobacter sp.]
MRPTRPSTLPAALLAAAALALPLAARPVDVADGQLTVHGDGQWAYQRTTSGNSFGEATPDGNYDTAMFDLVLSARPSPDLVISAQLGFDPQEVEAEWVFAEWRFSEQLRVRVGKVQQPIGNLNELRFAGTTRAFFTLPTSVYGPANVTGTAYLGAGLTGLAISEDGWTVAWDFYAGAVKLSELEGYRGLESGGGDALLDLAPEPQQGRDLLGGRLSLTTPSDLTVRLSGYGGHLTKDEGKSETFLVAGLSVQHRGERLWLDAEAFLTAEIGTERAWSGYATAAWWFTEHLQAALRLEAHRTTLDGYAGSSPLLRHQEVAASLNYWVSPSLAFKASFHQVEGNRFAYPEETLGRPTTPRDLVDSPPPTGTGVLVVGTQFAF